MRLRTLLVGLLVAGGLLALVLVLALVLAALLSEDGLGSGDRVAVVEVRGLIAQSKPVVDQLEKYRKDDRVKAIVLRIDSPGGAVAPSQEIFREVRRAREKKRVLASMGTVAASGGYYIAASAERIFANPGTITGSIGVIMEILNVSPLLDKVGLKPVVIKSGRLKDAGSPFREMSPEERRYIQGLLESVHRQFIEAVAEGRGLKPEQVVPLADGRIFTGEQAQRLRLVDELGSLQDTIERAAKLAGIPGRPQVVYPERRRPSLLDFLIERLGGDYTTGLDRPLVRLSFLPPFAIRP